MSTPKPIARGVAAVCLTLAAVLFAPRAARTDEPSPGALAVEGVVVRVDPGEIIVDVGRDQGVPAGAVVQLYRRLEVTHPVTGETLVDRFPIGRARLDEVGALLSIIRDLSDLEQGPMVGDVVVYEAAPGAMPSTPETGAPAVESAPPADPAQAALEEAFRETIGQPLDERIRVWQALLVEWPSAPFAERVAGELVWLRRELEAERRGPPPAAPQPPGEPAELRAFVSAPSHVYTDEPVAISAAVVERELVSSVRLLVRRADEPGYRTVVMQPDGDYNWGVDLGRLDEGVTELFVEAVRTNGALELLRGSAARPLAIVSEPPHRDAEVREGRSTTTTIFEYVDFNRGAPVDQYLRFEAEFRYALDVAILTGFRVGAGVFLGDGASLDALRAGQPSTPQNVNYGFAGLELSWIPKFGTQVRFLAGNGDRERDDESFEAVFGGQLVLRIGEAQGTRLELGGSLTRAIGNQAWAEILIEAFRRWPMSGSIVVTNLPVGEDLGVSLSYGIGYRFADWIAVSIRTGINARTVDDWGATGGLGLQLSW